MRKILILGLDGLCYEWLFRMNMKFLRRIDTKAYYGIMKSYIPPITPMAWTSILTGVSPEYHGIWYFHDESTLRPTCLHYDSKYPCLWHFLESLNIRGAWLWIPLTYPLPRAFYDKLFFAGIPLPTTAKLSKIMSIKLYNFIREHIGSYDMRKLCRPHRLVHMRDNITFRFKLIKALIVRNCPFIFAVIPETDLVWHATDSVSIAYDNVYVVVDKWLQELIPLAISKNYEVFIISDHGEADFTKYVVFINNILKRKGFIKSRTSLTHSLINSAIRVKPFKNLISIMTSIIPWTFLFEITLPLRKTPKNYLVPGTFLSYAMIGSSRYGYIKVKGKGIAQKALSERVMRSLQEELGDIVKTIYFVKDIYPNARNKEHDIIIELKKGYLVSIGILPYDIEILKTKVRYTHSLEGVFIWISREIEESRYVGVLKPEDITASIIARLGFKPPNYFTGKPKVPFTREPVRLMKTSGLVLAQRAKYLRKRILSNL